MVSSRVEVMVNVIVLQPYVLVTTSLIVLNTICTDLLVSTIVLTVMVSGSSCSPDFNLYFELSIPSLVLIFLLTSAKVS